mmetsp:Transcript_12629/g.18138  ORF Transcript_12629/g.18138 Transcript_12629/m.18138 type:complete len:710 (-) Transcript_12629:56-2185(-)
MHKHHVTVVVCYYALVILFNVLSCTNRTSRLLVVWSFQYTTCYYARKSHPTRSCPLHSTTRTKNTEDVVELTSSVEDGGLTDIDTKVLKSLLEEQPDLAMEQNIQRLLAKNEEWSRRQRSKETTDKETTESSSKDTPNKYSSQFIQTVTSTPDWWKSLAVKSSTLLESVGLVLVNKLERDIKLSLALGGFFWERVARDSTRVLKAASSTPLRALSSNSSFVQQKLLLPSTTELYESLNTPQDELKVVIRNMQDIFSGTITNKDKRALNSLIGRDISTSDRARRAYLARKKDVLKKQQQPLAITIANLAREVVVDGPRVLKEEIFTQPAGFKVRSVFQSIPFELGTALPSSSSSTTATTTTSPKVLSLPPSDAKKNHKNLALNIELCLSDPAGTWLIPETIQNATNAADRTKTLKHVICKMIDVRDELLSSAESTADANLQHVQQLVKEIETLAREAVGQDAATLLVKELVWDVDFLSDSLEIVTNSNPLKDSNNAKNIVTKISKFKESEKNNRLKEEAERLSQNTFMEDQVPFFVTVADNEQLIATPSHYMVELETTPIEIIQPEILYADKPEEFAVDNEIMKATKIMDVSLEDDTNVVFPSVLVSEEGHGVELLADDFEFSNVKAALPPEEDSSNNRDSGKENLLTTVTLRSLDAVFFIVEKLLLVGVPMAYRAGRHAFISFKKAQQSGRGSPGWQKLENLQDAARRY